MFGILEYFRLSNPMGIGGLQTVNLEIQLDIVKRKKIVKIYTPQKKYPGTVL
jgi:hypothetical protein